MIKAIIFDLDGTLLNTIDDLADSTNFVLTQFNYPQKTVNEINSFVGNGVEKLIERSIPEGKNNPDFSKCLNLFKMHYKDNMYNKTKPYPDISEMLINLKQNNYKTAVVSNKFDSAVKELSKKYFNNLIDIAIGENEINGIRKKPAPDMVLKVLDELDCPRSQSLYVGDSEVDILTAKNSNIPCISITWGFKDKEFLIKNGAEILIDNPKELINYL